MPAFRYSLNSSTIQPTPILDKIRIAAEAGYGAIELWHADIDAHRRLTEATLLSPCYACLPCLEDPLIPLSQCLLTTNKQKHVGNFMKHLKRKHSFKFQDGVLVEAPPTSWEEAHRYYPQ